MCLEEKKPFKDDVFLKKKFSFTSLITIYVGTKYAYIGFYIFNHEMYF